MVEPQLSLFDNGHAGVTAPLASTPASGGVVVNGARGRVLVVGGGIAGMQAALDLSQSGYYVYLVEKKSAIGGVMAALDKTFPTNDCAMCTISPKLVDVGRSDNIEILTLSQVTAVAGEAGAFRVRVRRDPSYVLEELCKGCNDCAEACPIRRPNEFNRGIDQRKAISRLYPQAVPNVFAIERKGLPPCQDGCPAGTSVEGYVALLREGRYAEAYNLILETNPFPAICGRICDHPCETACRRAKLDDALAIRDLKRFIADWAAREGRALDNESLAAGPFAARLADEAARAKNKGRRVAIVGAGPAGLACAARLAALGYAPVVFDRAKTAGGMLVHGIPQFRLPRDVIAQEIEAIKRLGVEIRLGQELGKDFTLETLRKDGFEATFIATGLYKSRGLGLKGEDAPNVIDALKLLRDSSQGTAGKLAGHVVVFGGGNVAMDAARTALRLGAGHVVLAYRRSMEEMPAQKDEVAEAKEEGVDFMLLTNPVEFLGGEGGRIRAVKCQRMDLGEPDASGRRRPVPIKGSEFEIACDTIILAIGQMPEEKLKGALAPVTFASDGTIVADRLTLATSIPGVYTGGDVAGLTGSVITAIASGNRAALSIDNQLHDRPLSEGQIPLENPAHYQDLADEQIDKDVEPAPRLHVHMRSAKVRARDLEEISTGFTEEEARAEAARCLECAVCSDCHSCVKACKAGAINFDAKPEDRDLEVGGIILSPGYEVFDAARKGEYAYGRAANVITSMEFERYLSASGPTIGHVVRPSDGREPKRMAFILCVGSRDETPQGKPYCSGVCCMYSTKEAMVAMDHAHGLATTIFYIDVRAHGKGYENYYNRAKDVIGVRYVRSMVSSLKEDPRTHNVTVRYTINGQVQQEEFDLVVLAVGLVPPAEMGDLAKAAGVNLGQDGFIATRDVSPIETSRPGVLACGAARGPMDIPDSVTDASAAAARMSALLPDGRWTSTAKKEYPPERDVTGEEPRIGVFVCHCGNNIAGVVNVKTLEEYARTLPGVVYSTTLLYTCSPDGLNELKRAITEEKLNRVVVTSCTPRTHGPIFMDACREAGLNPFLFEMGNIRDQCSWVHSDEPEAATNKALRILAGTVAKSRLLKPLHKQDVELEHRALVLGGGVAGLAAALEIANQSFAVDLVERTGTLGGEARDLWKSSAGEDVAARVGELERAVTGHANITLHLNTTLKETTGFVGNFASTLASSAGEGETAVKHGVIVVATGAQEYEPPAGEFGWGHPRVMSQHGLTVALRDKKLDLPALNSVVMIQCVGSRNKERPSCSRVCCTTAVQNAIAIKEASPNTNVYVLFRDIRTFGFRELLYSKARKLGVIFLMFDPDNPPKVETNGRVRVLVRDERSGENLSIDAGLVVLSTGIRDGETNDATAKLLKVPLTTEGFFLEAHIKLRPVDFATEGVFVAGLAHGPKFFEESIVQAQAAAGRAATILSQKMMSVGGSISVVDQDRCAACLNCVRNCPYSVPRIRDGVAYIEPAACQGCGICAAECPAKAIELACFTDAQVLESEKAIMEASK
jgi:heterodisulfide reductase subunit A-like polyferredoxin